MPAYISSIGTVVPPTKINQASTAEFMTRHLGLDEDSQKLLAIIYRASGIQYRHSVISDFARSVKDFSFFPKNNSLEPFPKVGDRMRLYEQEAIKLSMSAVKDCLPPGFDVSTITHLITVSCTGMYAPGLDIELVEHLGLISNIQRTSVNFMGCYAAFNALKLANHIINNDLSSNVLIVATELCSIHILKSNDEDSLLSNALFGDGSAAVLVQAEQSKIAQLELTAFYADLAPKGKDAMAWKIGDYGFEMKLSKEVPEVIKEGIGELTHKLLSSLQLTVADIDQFAIHPGGKRILEVIEQELRISKKQNAPAYEVLRDFGNMSSPTVLFVLKSILIGLDTDNHKDKILSFAFGPGLTLESLLLTVKQP
ncbi:MAG: type III polyketide synthase [Cyclobacteriaceae bacterium]